MGRKQLVLTLMASTLSTSTIPISAAPANPAQRAAPHPISPALPVSGAPVLPVDAMPGFSLTGPAGGSSVSMERTDQYGTAARLITKAAGDPWSVQYIATNTSPAHNGDVLLLTYWARAISPTDGSAVVSAAFQIGRAPWSKSVSEPIHPGTLWKRYDVPFKSIGDYSNGEAQIVFMLGQTVQSVEIARVSLTNYGASANIDALPRTRSTYAGREPNAPWRKAAAARIEKYRKGDLDVVVVDSHGRPVKGAKVHVRMTRNAFDIGSTVAANWLLGEGKDNEKNRSVMTSLFNQAVPENEQKWDPYVSWGHDSGHKMVDWFRAHGITVRGTNLVWPQWQYAPNGYKEKYEAKRKADGDAAAREWLRQEIDTHIREELQDYKGQCVEWDVINEPADLRDFQNILGPEAMAEWIKTAHEADPGTRLVLNDNLTFFGEGPDSAVQKRIEDVRQLLKQDAPLGGIGLETHITTSSIPTPAQILRTLDTYAAFNLPLKITEYDFTTSDADLGADYMRDILTIAYSHPAVNGFVIWGFWDKSHWLSSSPIYNADWTLKKSGTEFIKLIDSWKTGATDARGHYHVRGFLGDYAITVSGTAQAAKLIGTGSKVTVTLASGNR